LVDAISDGGTTEKSVRGEHDKADTNMSIMNNLSDYFTVGLLPGFTDATD
jgi:hypothetical protein